MAGDLCSYVGKPPRDPGSGEAQRSRVVLEVDGQQHYATADGAADPVRYAEMAAEDRSLRLAGYEVYRFGAHELTADRAVDGLRSFFRELLTAHHVLPA